MFPPLLSALAIFFQHSSFSTRLLSMQTCESVKAILPHFIYFSGGVERLASTSCDALTQGAKSIQGLFLAGCGAFQPPKVLIVSVAHQHGLGLSSKLQENALPAVGYPFDQLTKTLLGLRYRNTVRSHCKTPRIR